MLEEWPSFFWLSLMVSLGIGLLLGAERERDQALHATATLGGIRTFTLACLLGMLSAWMHLGLLLLAIGCVLLLVCVGYWVQHRHATVEAQQVGITTELALIVTVSLGGMSVTRPAIAAVMGIIIAALLASKTSLHQFVRNTMTQSELHQLLLLATASLIIYPLLPDRMLGPWQAINPNALWGIVIIVMSISAMSHVLMRVLGTQVGLPVSGFLSGFISSVATIQNMSERAKKDSQLCDGAIAGALWSSLSTVLQLVLILSVLSQQTLWQLRYPLLGAGLSIACSSLYWNVRAWRSEGMSAYPIPMQAPLSAALSLAGLIALVSMITAALKASLGHLGVYGIHALTGFLDVHAPTISLASLVNQTHLTAAQAAIAILLAFSMNTMTKLTVAYLSHQARFYHAIVSAHVVQLGIIWSLWGATACLAKSCLS